MGVTAYLRDRIVDILAGLFCIAIAAWIMSVLGVSVAATIFVSGVIAVTLAAAILYGFTRRRRFYNELDAAVALLSVESRAFLAAELIERPAFLEGEITYDALHDIGKSMNDEIAFYRQQGEGYRQYIETWIHEIKTPIAAARLMLAELHGPDAAKLKAEIDRIESYVEQALYYARSTSLEKDYAIRELPLAPCVRESVKKNATFLIGKGAIPSIDISENITVFADGKWLQFIIGQLLVNAAKYEADTITVTAGESEEGTAVAHTVLTVADDGCGIPAADIDSVFEKGFTGENGRRFGSSTGMGLYLCATMCAEMGLGISIASEQGTGTRVMIAFPHDRRRLDDLS